MREARKNTWATGGFLTPANANDNKIKSESRRKPYRVHLLPLPCHRFHITIRHYGVNGIFTSVKTVQP
jgi:hypothetical protein